MDLSYKEKGKDVRHNPLKHYVMGDGTAVAIYQGFRGENPDLDFIVKYKTPGQRLLIGLWTYWSNVNTVKRLLVNMFRQC